MLHKDLKRLCIYCKHYYFSFDTSEESCLEGEWENIDDSLHEERIKLLEKGLTCKKYKYYKGGFLLI